MRWLWRKPVGLVWLKCWQATCRREGGLTARRLACIWLDVAYPDALCSAERYMGALSRALEYASTDAAD